MDNTPLNAAPAETGLSASEAAPGLAREGLYVLPGGQHRTRLLAMNATPLMVISE